MATSRIARLRNGLWTIHRWIGAGLCLLLVPIALSGAMLVFKDQLDALMHPARYAVTGAPATLSPSAYFTSATESLQPGAEVLAVRYPAAEGWPVTIQARLSASGKGRPHFLTVYLDPPTARVLDVVEFRTTFLGYVHRIHENLTIPDYGGRSIAGWAGVGMLFLALSGIWLWWPRNGAFFSGFRWRRAPWTTTNLHHLLGFWISIPLALVSFTGIYLAFPQQARSVMSAIAPMSPRTERPTFFAQIAHSPALTADDALSLARKELPDARPSAVFLATAANATATPVWRVQLTPARGGVVTLVIDDRSREVRPVQAPPSGDRAAQWLRGLHEGNTGPIWRVVVFLAGLFPPIFAVTGVTMWLRGRRGRKRAAIGREEALGTLQAAE